MSDIVLSNLRLDFTRQSACGKCGTFATKRRPRWRRPRSLDILVLVPVSSMKSFQVKRTWPRPFEKREEYLFFGRDREARDLVSLIIANRVFVLYSQSGAGKSSLLNTKVTIGLEKEQCFVLPTARVQGKLPPNFRRISRYPGLRSVRGAGTTCARFVDTKPRDLGSMATSSCVPYRAHP
jgi:hypothetical protein